MRSLWRGLYYALLEGRFLFDFVHEDDLSADRLRGYRALLVPNAAYLDDAACAAIRDFVSSGRSLLATVAFCAALSLFYAAVGVGLVTATFGRDFAEGGRILAPYAIAIGLFSLAQVLVGYHLSRAETRYAWVVAAGVLVQLALLATANAAPQSNAQHFH